MKLQGSYTLPAKREAVWQLLNDPKRLAACLPGCEQLDVVGSDHYLVRLKLGLAAISGSFSGSVRLSDKKPPDSFRMNVEGRGAAGFVQGEANIELVSDGDQTVVRYSGVASVGGLLASVGNRMMELAARRTLEQFFANVASQLRA
ncbi:MAG: carbon monoxide dehydrogenase subunit G [Acidobacteriia bacterium]|jgi:carbon monoxide dehydrogenase subunit G|nr:carbon monoxide dehydrogenase subunit G [Terriglobia bacterium]